MGFGENVLVNSHRPVLLGLSMLAAFLLLSCDARNERTPDRTAADGALDTTTQAVDSVVIRLTGVDTLTVLDLLVQKHEVRYKTTVMGVFVSAIDSFENSSGVYWLYSVNDTMPQIACDKMATSDGDRVTWHFRKSRVR